jgi:hydrogenase maturation factor
MLKYVYPRLGKIDPSVIVGPTVGEDAAIIDLGNGRVLVIHSDAITGAIESLGWLAVHIVSNDIAVRGARPKWFLMSLFLPEGDVEVIVDKIMAQVDRAAKELDIMVVGGHTETTDSIKRPIAGTVSMGLTTKDLYVTTSGAKNGDYIIVTKGVGIEGTAVICTDLSNLLRERGVSEETISRGTKLLSMVSVVKEALLLAENKLVTSMHDPTEAGLIGGLSEVAYASKKTIEVYENRIPVFSETKIISSALNIDPYRLISSGTLVATIPPDRISKALKVLDENNVPAEVIGRVKEFNGNLVEIHGKDGSVETVRTVYMTDELFRLWGALSSEISPR